MGINGVGKTAILDCLAISLSHFINQMTHTEKFFYRESDIYNDASETRNQMTVVFEGHEAT